MYIKLGFVVSMTLLVIGCGGGNLTDENFDTSSASIESTTDSDTAEEASDSDAEEETGGSDTGEETDGSDTENETNGSGVEETAEIDTQASLIATFDGATFVSVETLDLGPTPTGVARGNWTVSFTADAVTWNYSDVVETGTYSIDGNFNPVANFSGREIEFSGDALSLDWDSRAYRRLATSLFDSQEALVNYFDGSTFTSVDEFDLGENAAGNAVPGRWSVQFIGNEINIIERDTIAVSEYSFIDGSSFRTAFGNIINRVYVLEGDELLVNSVIYERESFGKFDSQETLVEFLSGTSYASATRQPAGAVSDGISALGNWFLNFTGDTFTWNYADVEEAGTYLYLGDDRFSAVFPDRDLTVEFDSGDILWDGVRYIRQR